MAFPEAGLCHHLEDYELLRPYLHTRTLRFSYGSMAGRETDQWHAEVAKLPLPEKVERLALVGFSAIYLDRAGYTDNGAEIEAELSRLLGTAPVVSQSGRQCFFDMRGYIRSHRERLGGSEWERRSKAAFVALRQ
jgi:phosphoglycerol transferase